MTFEVEQNLVCRGQLVQNDVLGNLEGCLQWPVDSRCIALLLTMPDDSHYFLKSRSKPANVPSGNLCCSATQVRLYVFFSVTCVLIV